MGVVHEKFNVLFISVDDLRTALGCYGDPAAQTPNIDRLAASATVFNQAYCQQAVCNPSRASLLTGLRPDTIKVWDLKSHFRSELEPELQTLPQFTTGTHFREARPNVKTLPQYFKAHGYEARAVGKIFHGSPKMQDPLSWSAPAQLPICSKQADYLLPENQASQEVAWPGAKMAATEAADASDQAYLDGQVTDAALDLLGTLKDSPFFLAVGFRKPHLPFSAPRRYWDLYENGIAPPTNSSRPAGVPDYAWHGSAELRGYRDVPHKGPLPEALVTRLRHGYYACVSFIDAQVGRLLAGLEAHGLAEKTVIVLWGDHGFHLGEKALWGKTTNYELDTRAPLILQVPGFSASRTDALVEFVDIYPTLLDCCGLPSRKELEGISMIPLLDNPQQPWKRAAFSQFPRPWTYKGAPEVMGYSLRTKRFRYTAWLDFSSRRALAHEIYDHTRDGAEIHNLADDPAFSAHVQEYETLLRAGWRAALPVGYPPASVRGNRQC